VFLVGTSQIVSPPIGTELSEVLKTAERRIAPRKISPHVIRYNLMFPQKTNSIENVSGSSRRTPAAVNKNVGVDKKFDFTNPPAAELYPPSLRIVLMLRVTGKLSVKII
jgi:hypothetical protein